MPEHRLAGRGRLRCAALALLVLLAAPAVAVASPPAVHTTTQTVTSKPHSDARRVVPTLSGWLSPGVALPRRALIVTPHGQVGPLAVAENGVPVKALQTMPLSDPGPGDLGIVVALDTHSTMASSLPVALNAIGALAAERPAREQLGVIGVGSIPQTILPLTDVQSRISGLPTGLSQTGNDADLSSATAAAVAQISAAHLALGVLVVISDGVDVGASRASAATATAAHVPVITIGLHDSQATTSSLAALDRWAPGVYATATPSTVSTVLGRLVQALQSRYEVVRYRSSAHAGASVGVRVSATGARGTIAATYTVPARRPSHSAPATHHPRPLATAPVLGHLLSPSPAFITNATTGGVGFWSSGKAVLLVALLSALLVGVCVALILKKPSERAVLQRVGSYIPAESEADELDLSVEEKPTGLRASLQRGTWWRGYVEAVEVSRSTRSAGWLMRRAALIAAIVAVVFGFALHSVIWALVPLIGFPFVERWWVMRVAQKQRDKFGDTLPGYMQDMASAIRVGRSFVSAMAVVADNAEEPTRSEFERAVTDESLGRPLEESLTAVGRRMRSSDIDQIALIAELNRRSGSNVAEALDRVAEGTRERAELRREVRALTAQSKMSSSVLTGMPFVLLLALKFVAPKYAHPLFHTTVGIILLVVAVLLIVAGWKVMKKISTVGV